MNEGTGAITEYIDVAQLVLYAFWLFFAGLVYYIRREDKREGYPLEADDASPRDVIEGFPGVPSPKVFRLPHGEVQKPSGPESTPLSGLNARPADRFPGSPLEPIGNPMLAGVGPGSYAMRSTHPDLTLDGEVKIVPLRSDPSYTVASQDPDPRGKSVFGADGKLAGKVLDIWVDRSERLFRYYEVSVTGPEGERHVLLPANFARVTSRGSVQVASILAKHFADVPGTQHPDQVSLREEDQIVAYYGAGCLYAEPSRMGPLL